MSRWDNRTHTDDVAKNLAPNEIPADMHTFFAAFAALAQV